MSRGPDPSRAPDSREEEFRDQIRAINRTLQQIDGLDSAEVGMESITGRLQPVVKSFRIRVRDGASPAAAGAAIEEVANIDPANIQEVAASQLSLSNSYYGSVLAQARQSFRSAVIAALLGLMFFLAAVAISLVKGNLESSIISVVGGGIVEVIAGLNFWLYSKTAAQLDSFHLRLERMQRYLLANSVCLNLQGEQRGTAMTGLIQKIADSSTISPSGGKSG